MPGMFSRRPRGNSNPVRPVDRSVSIAATTAASQAFLSNSASNASLSNSAAAAALRSHTTTPEPVGSITTKRMARRGSVTSIGSGSVIGSGTRGGVGRGGLQRNNSGGSMTERTFRSPSPGRSNGVASPAPDAPPVPALPQSLRGAHQRSSSLEPVARAMSPSTGRGTRGVSVDRGSKTPTPATPSSARNSKRLSNVPELEREDSRNSINFSRPMSTQGSPTTPAPTTSKPVHGGGSWFTSPTGGANLANVKPTSRPLTSDGISTYNTAQSVQAASTKPVKKNKNISSAQGSHLANRTERSTPISTKDEDSGQADTIMVFDSNTRTFVPRPRPKETKQQPLSPPLAQPVPLRPGEYDPSTRKIVPESEPRRQASSNSLASDAGSIAVPKKKKRPVVPAVDTDFQPPPRNPARISETNSPTSPRMAGMLQKQPSVVREDPQAEAEAEALAPAAGLRETGSMIQTSAGPARAYIAVDRPHQRAVSLDVPRPGNPNVTGRPRGGSVSPARSAHFSQSPVMDAVRHTPPARGLSPVKSALKHSPSSSIRTTSPMATFSPAGPRGPASEASDTTSLASQDGYTAAKKKKGARVSFDEAPREMDPATAATPEPKALVRDISPRYDNDDMEELMKPRPALPSFGSVRKGRVQPDIAEKVTERPPMRHEASSDLAVGGILANEAAKRQSTSEPLPPEVTTRDEAASLSDYSGDETPAASSSQPGKPSQAPIEPKIRDFANATTKATEPAADEVPAISLQPPTPGIEESAKEAEDASPRHRSSLERFNVPGGWDWREDVAEPTKEVPKPVAKPVENDQRSAAPVSVPTAAGPAPAAAAMEPPAGAPVGELSDIAETDSDDSAAFSDAAEDLSDLEDGGFASLDAIVESPAAPHVAPGTAITTPPESPIGAQAATSPLASQNPDDWTAATAYWSKLSRQQREQIEREHFSSDDEVRTPVAATAPKMKKKKVAPKPAPLSAPVPASAPAAARPQQQQALPSAMKKSMRAQPGPATVEDQVHMRSSMRDGPSTMRGSMRDQPGPAAAEGAVTMRRSMRDGPPTMRGSMRDQARPQSEYMAPRLTAQRDSRPSSAGNLSATAAAGGAMTQRAQSPQSPKVLSQSGPFPNVGKKSAPPPATASRLSKQITEDSDSESSFKKKRRPSVSTVESQGRYSMKRSMRAGSVDLERRPISPTPAGRGRGTFSLRSLSPNGSFMGKNKGEQLRESLRASPADSGARTLRGPPTTMRNKPQGSRFGGGGFGGGASARPTTTSSGIASKFKSRFADSDEEDDDDRGRRSGPFRSRFADSDEEDGPRSPAVIPADLTPVRGIPRRSGQNDGDSTDLSDEEDDDPRKSSRRRNKQSAPIVPDPSDIEKAMEIARRNLGITNTSAPTASNEGTALQKGSLRDQAPAAPESPAAQEQPKKRGFMGSILRRNRNSSSSITQVNFSPMSSQQPPLPNNSAASIQAAQEASQSTPSSPSLAKLVRRSSAQPQARLKRGDSNFSNAATAVTDSPSAAGGLRSSKELDSWPLPPPPKVTANGVTDDRPNTSDGIHERAVELARTLRPDLIGRRADSEQAFGGNKAGSTRNVGFREDVEAADGERMTLRGDGKGNAGAYSSKTGKKKKFGMLRRAFGLYD